MHSCEYADDIFVATQRLKDMNAFLSMEDECIADGFKMSLLKTIELHIDGRDGTPLIIGTEGPRYHPGLYHLCQWRNKRRHQPQSE